MTPSMTTFVVSRNARDGKRLLAHFRALHPRFVTMKELPARMAGAAADSLWICDRAESTCALIRERVAHRGRRRLGDGLILHEPDASSAAVLAASFRAVGFPLPRHRLPLSELAAVLAADDRDEMFLGASADPKTSVLTLWRGNLRPLFVPFSAFPVSGDGTEPDFTRATVCDHGQTVRLGDYEAAADAILYEHDPEHRRRISLSRSRDDRRFGACLRRLRKQRGLTMDDFAPLDRKTISRIENCRTRGVRAESRRILADRLGVAPDEIGDW